ncbi:glycosyltransferase family 2 protein [Paenibacillus piri]|uniref:Glycosyltransferase n=1 Tax=Paenibacillus piri TaxID=2547395 RepID=A0A4V2ZTA3_9BACL|nr:glycosyltransferase family 2 protein [Paenibacillus piri]TDF96334.1 glycosyltransferase [Paenibacillus piri]
MKKLISVIGPMFNEEGLVSEYCSQTLKVLEKLSDKYDYELILVDDGSSDRTYSNMMDEQRKHPHIGVVKLSRNFGLEGAVHGGIEVAKGDAVIVMDADLQDPPELIYRMIEMWEDGYDVVSGKRIERKSDSLFKKMSAWLFYKVTSAFSNRLVIEENAANYKLLNRRAIDEMKKLPEVNRIFRVLVPYVGLKAGNVEYARDIRTAGQTKYNLKSMIRYALDSLVGTTIEPLRFIMSLGFFTILLGILLTLSMLVMPVASKDTSLILAVLLYIAGAVFICLGLIGEYVGQILIEVKRRPASIIDLYSAPNAEHRE